MEENIKEDIEREKEKKRKSKKKKQIIWIALIVAVPIFLILHNEENIFYRTRFVYRGKETTTDWVRQQSHGFLDGKAGGTPIQSLAPAMQKLFKMPIVGVGKDTEAKVIKTTPFIDEDLSRGQYWVQKQSSMFNPVFWYIAYYEYEGDCYLRMKFSIDNKRKSYSSMFRVENTSREEIEHLRLQWD